MHEGSIYENQSETQDSKTEHFSQKVDKIQIDHYIYKISGMKGTILGRGRLQILLRV
jgi:hypothetical protein